MPSISEDRGEDEEVKRLEKEAWVREARVQGLEEDAEQADELIRHAKSGQIPKEPTEQERRQIEQYT